MKLFYSPVHDFIHKSVVVAQEVGVWDQIETVAVYPRTHGYSIAAINPLAKVPTLVLNDGQALFGSQVIAEYLDSISANGLHVYPSSGPSRWDALTRLALADIFFDLTVRIIHEHLVDTPGEHIVRWSWPKLMRALDRMERDAANFEGFDIGQIGTLQALTYFDRQIAVTLPQPAPAEFDWRIGRPGLTQWFEQAIRRPSVAGHFKQAYVGDDSPEFCQHKVAEVLRVRGEAVSSSASALPPVDFVVPATAPADRAFRH